MLFRNERDEEIALYSEELTTERKKKKSEVKMTEYRMKGSGWHNKHIAELVNNRECTPNTTGRKRENAYYAHGTGCDTWKKRIIIIIIIAIY